jgi:hypothetical protein
MDEAGDEQWWLVAQVPPTRPGTKSDLDILRQLSGDELAVARRANELLNRLAQAAPYARLAELFAQLEAALARGAGKTPASPKRVAAELNRAAVALGKAAADLPDTLLRGARQDFPQGSDELAAIEQAVAEECGRPPFRLLVAVGKLERSGFAAVGDGVGNDAEAIAALRREVAEVTDDVDLISTIRGGVIVAQRLIGRQLQIYEERIRETTLNLRRPIRRRAASRWDRRRSNRSHSTAASRCCARCAMRSSCSKRPAATSSVVKVRRPTARLRPPR